MFISISILYLYLYYTDIYIILISVYISIYLYIDISIYLSISLSLYIVHIHILYLYSYKAYKPPYFSAWWPPKWGRRRAWAFQLLHGRWLRSEEVGAQWRSFGPTVGVTVEVEMGISSQFAGDFHGNHQRKWWLQWDFHGKRTCWLDHRTDEVSLVSNWGYIRLYIVIYRKSFYKWENPWIGDEPDFEGY